MFSTKVLYVNQFFVILQTSAMKKDIFQQVHQKSNIVLQQHHHLDRLIIKI